MVPSRHIAEHHPGPVTSYRMTSPWSRHVISQDVTLVPSRHIAGRHPGPVTSYRRTSPWSRHVILQNITMELKASGGLLVDNKAAH
ncbi:hypothetical protein ACOMHN_028399 [Nucella lapillus]